MELFLSGDDSVFSDDELLRDLIARKFFAEVDHVPFDKEENMRLEKLENRYQEWRSAYDAHMYRQMAIDNSVCTRYEILIGAGNDPQSAFHEAIGPGPKSIVLGVPRDEKGDARQDAASPLITSQSR